MHQPPAVERAAWALAELCAGNAANKAAVLELHGIAPLVWLLDGPADSMVTTGALLEPPAVPGLLLDPLACAWSGLQLTTSDVLRCSGNRSCKALDSLVWLLCGPADSLVSHLPQGYE